MNDDDLLAEWTRARARVDVPDGFARRVLDALPPAAPPSAGASALATAGSDGRRASPPQRVTLAPLPGSRWLATTPARVAALLLAAAACLFRALHLIDLFLV